MSVIPSLMEVHRAEKRLRTELEAYGMLLAHDVLLPSASRCISGESIRGSWWGHPSGRLIYATLQRVESDIARVKLVGGKSTLVHRALWPSLAAVARCRKSWQTAGLCDEAQDLLREIERTGGVQANPAKVKGARRSAGAIRQLESRLLVFSKQEHTAAGHHTKTLVPFTTWQLAVGLSDSELPDLDSALESLTHPVRSWVGDRVEQLLPWHPA